METDIPVQPGPVYHCFNCGAEPATFAAYFKSCGSALDAWGLYIWYLKLPCNCRGADRVVRLGDVIAPLAASHPDGLTPADIPAIQAAIRAILKAMPPEKAPRDPATRIVYEVLSGSLSPVEAIAQLHGWARKQQSLPAPSRPGERILTNEPHHEGHAITFLKQGARP